MGKLISLDEFAYLIDAHPDAVKHAVERGDLPTVDGMIDPEVARPVWEAMPELVIDLAELGKLTSKEVELLKARAKKAGIPLERYLRQRLGSAYPVQ